MRYFLKLVFFLLRKKETTTHTIIENAKNNKDIRVEVLPEGGVNTHIKGLPHPYPGFPTTDVTNKIHATKSVLPLAVEAIYKGLSGSKADKRCAIIEDTKHLSKSVREIYRLFDLLIERSLFSQRKKWRMARDVICSILEYDDSYRFPMQDILSELNKDEIKLTEADRYFVKYKCYKAGGIDESGQGKDPDKNETERDRLNRKYPSGETKT